VIHPNASSRYKSRLQRLLKKAKLGGTAKSAS
jgi:hypothetical protein